MKNAIKTQHAMLLENPTFNRMKDYKLHGVSSVQLFLIASAVIVFLVSLATQGFSGSTVVQSIGAIIGGGIAGAVTAFILTFLRLLLKQDSWKLASIILGVGITAAVFTGSYALQISMPPLAGFIGYVSGLILILNYFVRFQPKTELPLIFGSARWAMRQDLADAAMLAPAPAGKNVGDTGETGLFLGQDISSGEAIIYNGDMHAMTIAPTRTGKDQTAILPNLVRSTGSMAVSYTHLTLPTTPYV